MPDDGAAPLARIEDYKAKRDGQRTLHRNAVALEDFYAYMPAHNYIWTPARTFWPAASVNSRIPPIKLEDERGHPVLDKDRKQVVLTASAWLDRHRPRRANDMGSRSSNDDQGSA